MSEKIGAFPRNTLNLAKHPALCGAIARLCGNPASSNPYSTDCREYAQWLSGWGVADCKIETAVMLHNSTREREEVKHVH